MVWQVAAPLISGFLGYKAQQDKNKQIQANNALLKEQYEWQKSKEVPGVTGAQDALSAGYWVDPATGQPVAEGTEGAQWQSQFQPFINAAGQNAIAGTNIAQQYLANVPSYQQAGLQGLAGYQHLASLSPADQKALADRYSEDYGQSAYDIAATDINRQADANSRNLARDQGRFGALSSQKGRANAYIDQARTDALLKAGERARQVGYDRSQAELLRQQGLAGTLSAFGTSGLSQAQQASQLGQGSYKAGINAPFLPFQVYGQTVSAQPTAQAPTYGFTQDPFATGAGLGLQAWQAFNPGGQS